MKIIEKLLQERISSAKKELEFQEKQLAKLREPPILARNDELIASISYTVGHLNAVIFENELFLSILPLTEEELQGYLKKREEIEERNEKILSDLIAEAREMKPRDRKTRDT